MRRKTGLAALTALLLLLLSGCTYSPGVESTQNHIREHMETNLVAGRQTTAVTLLNIDQTEHARQVVKAIIQYLRMQKSHTRGMPILNSSSMEQAVAYISEHQNTGDALMFASTASLMQLGAEAEEWYNSVKPLSSIGVEHIYIVVRADSPWQNLDQLIDAMKKGETVRWGWNAQRSKYDAYWTSAFLNACGCGAQQSIALQEIESDIALSILSGQTDVLCAMACDVLPLLQEGELRALGTMSPERFDVPVLRDVPTLREYGLDVVDGNQYILYCPNEYPIAHKQYWIEQISKLLHNELWQQRCKEMGIMPPYSFPEA